MGATAQCIGDDRQIPRFQCDGFFAAYATACQQVFAAAVDLANQLHHDEVEPLHLLAALFSQQSARTSGILTRVGTHKEAVIDAIRTQLL